MINITGSCSGYSMTAMSPMQNTRLNSAQMAEELLSAADADNDGSVSKEEFTSMLQGLESSAESDIADGLFKQLDTNGDSVLSNEETVSAIDTLLEQIRQSMSNGNEIGNMPPPPPNAGHAGGAEELMSAMDTNDDGSIDRSEFATALQRMGGSDSSDVTERIEAMFNEADSDGNGSINQDELETVIANHRPPQRSTNYSSKGSTNQVPLLAQIMLNQYSLENSNNNTLSETA